MLSFALNLLITAAALLIISKLPLGVSVGGFSTAVIAALVFGFLNAFVKPVLRLLALPLTILTLGLFSLVVNAGIFGMASWLVPEFRLENGFWSALWGSLLLSLIVSIIHAVVPGDRK